MKRKHFILAVTLIGAFGCLYLVHNLKKIQQGNGIHDEFDKADCKSRTSKRCSLNCTVCIRESCLDVNSAGVCDSPDIQYPIQSYFQSLKLNKVTIVQIRCNDAIVTAKIDVNNRKDFVSNEQTKQNIYMCNNDIWVTFMKSDLQQRNMESLSTPKRIVSKEESKTIPSRKDAQTFVDDVTSKDLVSGDVQYKVMDNQQYQSPVDNNGQLQSDVTYPQMFAKDKQTNQQWTPVGITKGQYFSLKNHKGINSQLQETFERIAERNVWQAPNETRSGKGSLLASTVTLRECLGEWIKKYNITSIMDIPCGDGNWQRYIPGIDKISYHGFDISTFVIDIAKKRNPPNMKYGVLDLTSNVPPKADLIIMRDVIQHLPLRLGMKAIFNAQRSGVKWIGVSSYPSEIMNKDIPMGDYYRNNIQISPFFLTNVIEMCDNYSGHIKLSHEDSKFLLIENKDVIE